MSRTDEKRRRLREVLRGLVRMYGRAPEPPRRPALDVLISAMLSQNTSFANAKRGYDMLRRRFNSWTKVMRADVAQVQREIAICGLARMRSRRLQEMLARIKREQGKLSLDALADRPAREAFEYLMSFHGIGPKTAAYAMLFGFGHAVLPVDNGILRIARRLRLVRGKARDLEAEQVLSPLVGKGKHNPTHVLLFRHAKERCRPKNPRCDECALLKMCPHGQRVIRHRPPARGTEPLLPLRKKAPLARFVSAGIAKREEGSDSGRRSTTRR